jgi:hypothetical protein
MILFFGDRHFIILFILLSIINFLFLIFLFRVSLAAEKKQSENKSDAFEGEELKPLNTAQKGGSLLTSVSTISLPFARNSFHFDSIC